MILRLALEVTKTLLMLSWQLSTLAVSCDTACSITCILSHRYEFSRKYEYDEDRNLICNNDKLQVGMTNKRMKIII